MIDPASTDSSFADTASPDPGAAFHAFDSRTGEVAAAVADLGSKGAAAAAVIDTAFVRAGESLSKTLAKAASDGKLSLGELASAAIRTVDVFAGSSAAGSPTVGLAATLGSVLSGVFAGARADGGPVGAGGSYLVGERGPEVFRPSTAGEVSPLANGGSTVVNVSVQGGGAASILRSEAQIAAALARAVSVGAR